MKFRPAIILLCLVVFFNTKGFGQSWKPKPLPGFRLAEGGMVSCGVMVSFIDTSKIVDPCNSLKDSCDSIIEWTWKLGNGQRSNLKNPIGDYSHITLESGFFNVTLVIKTKYGYSDSVTYPIFIADHQASFTVKKDTIIEVGDSVIFGNYSSPPGNKRKFEWNFGDGKMFTDTVRRNMGHRYNSPGKFEVYLKYTSEILLSGYKTTCSDISPDLSLNEKKITITVKEVGSVLNKLSGKLTLFPNPANDYIMIKGIEKGNLTIYDVYGKKIKEADIQSNKTFDISWLTKGIYFIKYFSNGLNYTVRFIKN